MAIDTGLEMFVDQVLHLWVVAHGALLLGSDPAGDPGHRHGHQRCR